MIMEQLLEFKLVIWVLGRMESRKIILLQESNSLQNKLSSQKESGDLWVNNSWQNSICEKKQILKSMVLELRKSGKYLPINSKVVLSNTQLDGHSITLLMVVLSCTTRIQIKFTSDMLLVFNTRIHISILMRNSRYYLINKFYFFKTKIIERFMI